MKQMSLETIKKNCFINAPWIEFTTTYVKLFIEHKIQPEIGLEGTCLYDEEKTEFIKIAALLQKEHLACTIHAPFFDLAAGALDPFILQATRDKLHRAFELLPIFKPRSIVCHLQYEKNKHGYVFDRWMSTMLETWAPLLQIAANNDVPVMFENTFEENPSTHLEFLQKLSSPYARFCLDVGHLTTFSKSPFERWLPALSPFLGQLHLHDNNGEGDEHLAPGEGIFDFESFFAYLNRQNLKPIITLEPHSEDDLWKSFNYLMKTQLLKNVIFER